MPNILKNDPIEYIGLFKFKEAKELHEKEEQGYLEAQKKTKGSSNVDYDFVKSVLKSGTVSDKAAALSLMIAESPVHSLQHLNTLLQMSKKKGRKEALLAIESLCELAQNTLLPDKKLCYYQDQQVPKGTSKSKVPESTLIEWYFEDALKKLYFELIQVLEQISHDTLRYVREKAITHITQLLMTKPEQRNNLLALLTNKLGDSERQVASKASYSLLKLLNKRPEMKMEIVKSTEQVMFRPNVTARAQYYGLVFLNQIPLQQTDVDAARYLINLYFQLFFMLTTPQDSKASGHANKKIKFDDEANELKVKLDFASVNPKMLTAMLAGIHRAYPYSKMTECDSPVEQHIEALFKLTHAATFSITVEALMLIQLVASHKPEISDRFYRTLYWSLFDPEMLSFSKPAMYLNLVYKSLKLDSKANRIFAFIKRLAQVSTCADVPFAAGVLYMLSELLRDHPGAWSLVKFAEEGTEQLYDWKKREPAFCAAEGTCLWELVALSQHFHPTLSLYAKTLLKGKHVEFPGDAINYDPLLNHTLIRFLDRLAYKNPKQSSKRKESAEPKPHRVTEPKNYVSKADVYGNVSLLKGGRKQLLQVNSKLTDDAPVNDAAFAALPVERVNPDEKFCHHFFQLCPKEGQKSDDVDFDGLFETKMNELAASNGNISDEDSEFEAGAFGGEENSDVGSDMEFGSLDGLDEQEADDDDIDEDVFADASEYEHLINKDD